MPYSPVSNSRDSQRDDDLSVFSLFKELNCLTLSVSLLSPFGVGTDSPNARCPQSHYKYCRNESCRGKSILDAILVRVFAFADHTKDSERYI